MSSDPLESELLPLLENGKKIQAIKIYRNKTGAGLADAKKAVEEIAEKHGLPASSGAGCMSAGMILLAIVSVATFCVLAFLRG